MADIVDSASDWVERDIEKRVKMLRKKEPKVLSIYCSVCSEEIEKKRREVLNTNLCINCARGLEDI